MDLYGVTNGNNGEISVQGNFSIDLTGVQTLKFQVIKIHGYGNKFIRADFCTPKQEKNVQRIGLDSVSLLNNRPLHRC